VSDSRRHRGPHPLDEELFSERSVPQLRDAVADLSWLRTRGYAERSAVKIVGDRYSLRQRQRVAVGRCACSDASKADRESRRVDTDTLVGKPLVVDGLNVITTIEVALAGGALFLGRDGCMRDMASFHGSYRLVEETNRAVQILVELVDSMQPAETVVYVDRPVSNSGRLAAVIRDEASSGGSRITAVTADDVDGTLIRSKGVVATADSAVLDRCGSWVSLARVAVERYSAELPRSWLLDLSGAD
jgi:hypothetical protein